jgi:hypothetical protein
MGPCRELSKLTVPAICIGKKEERAEASLSGLGLSSWGGELEERFVTILMIMLLECDQVRGLSLVCRHVQFNDYCL